MDAALQNFWVFGYGSLIWNPNFPFSISEIARLHGWARSFCMRSIHHRGTVENPGLVLALDEQVEAHCDGVAFLVKPDHHQSTLALLRERELVASAYLEKWLPITLQSGAQVQALSYVIDRDHAQYCGGLSLAEQVKILANAKGQRGHNRDYLVTTALYLRDLGIEDPDLTWLWKKVDPAFFDNRLGIGASAV
ncbi:MAG: cation transport protein ChaC [Paracoccaceae bacterium]|jgi:cation transport protein ChaC